MKIRVIKLILPFVVLFMLSSTWSCAPGENDTLSGSKLLLLKISGSSYFSGGLSINTSIISNDTAFLELRGVLLNPAISEGTYYESIDIEQVDVEYSRPDGKNEQGVDVPYAFSQYLFETVLIGETISLPFVIVRDVAKLEAPLKSLEDDSQEKVLQLTARITVHSKDKAGNRLVPVEGTISLFCSDYFN